MITIQNLLPTIVGTDNGETFLGVNGTWKLDSCHYVEVLQTNGWGTNVYLAIEPKDGDTVSIDSGAGIRILPGANIAGALFYGFTIGIAVIGMVLAVRWIYNVMAKTSGIPADTGL